MEKYKFFDKTADAKFQAFGATVEEAFTNAEEAMVSLMYKIDEIKSYEFDSEEREILIEADNYEGLLYKFLEEILFLFDAEFFVGLIDEIKIKEPNPESETPKYKLKAKLLGTQSINLENHGEVKAVTYNEMYVKDTDDGFEVQVVVDL